MSSVLHEWQDFGRRYRLCSDRMTMGGWQELSPFHALWVLRVQFADPQGRRMLIGALLRNGQWSVPRNLIDPGVLEREVELRRIIVLQQPLAPLLHGRSLAKQPPSTPPPSVEPRRERAWIEITVVDDCVPARPLAQTRFRLSLPDGSVHQGTLNGQAHLRVDDIDPGKCWLELSDLGRDCNG